MAIQCKKCKKVTRNKKNKLFSKRPRCRGCGSFDFMDIADAFVIAFDFEDLLYFGEEGYDSFDDMEILDEGPMDVSEDRFVESSSISEPAYAPEPEPERSSSYGSSSSFDSDSSSSYDSGGSDSCDCGGCD